MERELSRTIYCIDTSSLITIQRIYPLSVFPSLWDNMSELVKEGQLVAPREVLEELRQGGDDEILQWAKNNSYMFLELDSEQIEVAKQIINDKEFEGFVDYDKEIPEADPFVIALIVVKKRQATLFSEEWIVITDEHHADPGKKPKIPNVCKKYDIKCGTTLDMFKWEGWTY